LVGKALRNYHKCHQNNNLGTERLPRAVKLKKERIFCQGKKEPPLVGYPPNCERN